MRSKSLLLLTLAGGCGLVASIGISQVMDRRGNGPVGATEAIFVAMADINPNEPLTAELVKLEEWPQGKVPAGALSKVEDFEGQRTLTKIFCGEPILRQKMLDPSKVRSASTEIPAGYRVVQVRVDAVSGGGLILPADRVDVLVYVSRNPGQGIQETGTKTILQDVRVFSVDREYTRDPGQEQTVSANTIGLLVTPSQAEKVTLATELGSIRLVMRSPDDQDTTTNSGSSVSDLLGDSDRADREAERSQPPSGDDGGLMAWLNDNQKSLHNTAEPAATSGPWRIVMLKGVEVSEVELGEDGESTLGASILSPHGSDTPAADAE